MLGMPLIRLAMVTCIVYLILTFAVSGYLSTRKEDVLVVFSSLRGYFSFGVLWAVAFTIALRIEYWLVGLKLSNLN
jgi:hypothetical protein